MNNPKSLNNIKFPCRFCQWKLCHLLGDCTPFHYEGDILKEGKGIAGVVYQCRLRKDVYKLHRTYIYYIPNKYDEIHK